MFNEELAKHIDFNNLTMEECKSLRFGRWDKESSLMLFPKYLVPLIPEGLMITFIDGTSVPYTKNISNDTRLGRVAYGIFPKDK